MIYIYRNIEETLNAWQGKKSKNRCLYNSFSILIIILSSYKNSKRNVLVLQKEKNKL
jgi:hypothetical protein